jgi:enoyl-CoA hydratase
MGMDEDVVRIEVSDRVATVTLNRPGQRNALNRALMYGLWDAITAVGADENVAVVILTGADPAFSAGVDLKEVSGEIPSPLPARGQGEGPERGSDGLWRFLPVIDKPIIGAINGVAVTGGLEIALQCTFLVASDRARFADTHARLGVMPGGGMTVLLADYVGHRRAVELSLTGNFLGAEESLGAGLVNHVVAHSELLPFTRALATDIAGSDERSVRTLLGHYRLLATGKLREAHLLEGVLAETWQPGVSLVAERQAEVIARGRSQHDA